MRATGPTARPPHPARKFGQGFLDPDASRFLLFARDDPANPLVTRQGRDIVPYGLRRAGRRYRLF